MATGKMLSPAVFTRENDQSFLASGIGQIGAVVIGPTGKGRAFMPTPITNANDYNQMFGENSDKTYVPYVIKNYLKNAGVVHIVRVLGVEGWHDGHTRAEGQNSFVAIYMSGSSGGTPTGVQCAAILAVTSGSSVFTNDVAVDVIGTPPSASLFLLSSSIGSVTCSFDWSNPNYIEKVLGRGPESIDGNALSSKLYVYSLFKNWANSGSIQLHASASQVSSSVGTFTFLNQTVSGSGRDYSAAFTPWIQSQQSISGGPFNLLRFATIADGNNANTSVKISIDSIKKSEAGSSDYGSFNVIVRQFDDLDTRVLALETFPNATLNPTANNYILKLIGDKYDVIDSDGRISSYGDYPNKSKYVRIIPATGLENFSNEIVPFGHSSYYNFASPNLIALPMRSYQGTADTYNSSYYWGIDLTSKDAIEFMKPLPDSSTTNVSGSFNLDTKLGHSLSTYTQSLSSSLAPSEQLNFTVAFQFGWDGMPSNRASQVGTGISATNVFGFNCNSSVTSGSVAYKKALNTVSDSDLFDINMIVVPGILETLHPKVTEHARNICLSRQDCFYVMDCVPIDASLTEAVNSVLTIDDNFTATYYPWIQIFDQERNKNVWVPPSVGVAEAISFNDKVASPWYAPAGLNRGGIEAVDVRKKLIHTERDTLYDARVNPIATFPGQGISIWGQKTLQKKASALDRVNVRRLLIALKKFIASTAQYLVFEPNTNTTRQYFLNIVNPYLDSVQRKAGIYAYRVVMDDTNNPPDVIDRNILKGEIYIQPTRAAEFIELVFNVMPTGATFSE